MINEDNIQDVDFTEDNAQKEIRGSVLYYSTSQVAQILNIPDSTVRYYTKVFDEILNIEVFNKQRKYKQGDIDKLKYIVELKNDGLSVKQINEYCAEVNFDLENGIQVKESNPLSIQTLSRSLMEQQAKEFEMLKQELFERVDNQLKEMNSSNAIMQDQIRDDIKQEVAITIDEVVSDKFNSLENSLEEMKREIKIAYITNQSIKEYENPPSFLSKLSNLFKHN